MVDTLGLMLGIVVHSAAVQDRDGAEALLRQIRRTFPFIDVIFAEPSETVDSLLERMTDRRIRHLPVCDDGHLIGIVSIGDLVKTKIAETVAEAEGLRAYITAA